MHFLVTLLLMMVRLMNAIGYWIGAMPCYHSTGRFVGNYKFSGRCGVCMVILRLINLVLGLMMGSSLVKILVQFAIRFLEVMHMFLGIQLVMTSKNTKSMENCFVMLICNVVSLIRSNSMLGLVHGIVVHLIISQRSMSEVEYYCSIEWHC